MTIAELVLILMVCAILLGFLFLVSLDRKLRKGGPRRIEGVSTGRPYLWFVLISGVIGFIALLGGIISWNVDVMIEGAVWLVVASSVYRSSMLSVNIGRELGD